MPEMVNARATALSQISRASTRRFDVALHSAATSSIESMAALHQAVCECVNCMRDGDVDAVNMVLAMKRCALDSAARYRPYLDELPASNVNMLIDQIVKWAIVEYYRARS